MPTSIPRSTLDGFRRRLLERQRALCSEVEGVENELRRIEDSPHTELGERAQQEAMKQLLDRLEDRERRELEDVHRALLKIATGKLGTCETCGRAIAIDRLHLEPSLRRCLVCERTQETAEPGAARSGEAAGPSSLPPEYADLDDAELGETVREHLRDQGDPDLARVRVRCRGGVVHLAGDLPSEAQRGIVLEIVGDTLGLGFVDRLRVIGLDREDTGGEEAPPAAEVPEEERIPAGRGMRPLPPDRPGVPEDEGEPPDTPPERPVPEPGSRR